MNELKQVEYTCPQCGVQWTEWENLNDDWFGLGTDQTLCVNCGQEVMKRIIENWGSGVKNTLEEQGSKE